jgi:phosphate-selective porin OprO/OprP
VLLAQNPAEQAPAEPVQDEPATGLQFRFKEKPSLRFRDDFRLDLEAKWQFDFRHFNPSIANPPVTTDSFVLQRARFGLKGFVTRFFSYEAERDLRGTFSDDHPEHPWKDVYVEFQPNKTFQLKVGKFKLPFGMEQNTSSARLDFINRSRVSDFLTPARERGAMLHGKFLSGGHLGYDFGVFRFDGENSGLQGAPSAGRTYAARISGEPLQYVSRLPKVVRHAYVGLAMTTGEMFEGQSGIRGQTISNFTYFDRVFVKGNRRRIGMELSWTEGPFALKGEYIHVSEQRKGQGIRLEDLPDKISRGWYVTTSWVALGQMKSKGSEPKDPFITGKGYGALELAARLDVLTFYSASHPGLPSRSPRAPNILPNGERTWTFGSTWYINHFVKIQGNAEREWVIDIARRPVEGRNVFWTGIIRIQFAM